MKNVDYWNTFVGAQTPETFMRNYGSIEPEVCVARFLEERGQLYGVVNQGTWVKTFATSVQHHCHSVKAYLLSYLEDTREEWFPSLESSPPATPRRYREKFDQDRFPPPGEALEEVPVEEPDSYGSYVPDSDHDMNDGAHTPVSAETAQDAHGDGPGVSFEEFEADQTDEGDDPRDDSIDSPTADVIIPEPDTLPDEREH